MKQWWERYRAAIYAVCLTDDPGTEGLPYWRNKIFADTLVYTLPFMLIALVPGMYWSHVSELPVLVVFDLLIAVVLVLISLVAGIHIFWRKVLFMATVYVAGCTLIYFLSLLGPGLIYIYAASTFGIFFFSQRHAYTFALINTAICVAFAAAIYLAWVPWPDGHDYSLGSWIAVTTNLVFLSFLSAAHIPRVFTGLQGTIDQQRALEEALEQKQKKLGQALEELQQKNSDLEQFASVASHDLKEPLRTVNSFMQLLEKKYAQQLDSEARKYIDLSVTSAQHMSRLIDDLLSYSRISQQSDWVKIAPEEVIDEILSLKKPIIETTRARVEVGPLPVIHASRIPLRILFQNLIANALKYQPQGNIPEIKISGKEFNKHYLFSVTDNGIGIEPAYAGKIFVIFQRLHSKDEYSGTGMGLAICKKIVEQHGGTIWVESKGGKGSTFYFTLAKE